MYDDEYFNLPLDDNDNKQNISHILSDSISNLSNVDMEIEMSNFKCFTSYNIILQAGKLILLKGNSGVGKTTIFDAITWCLYGKNKNVGNNTSVTITTTIITINRKRLPKNLIVKYNTKQYLDKSAQEIINEVFGSFRLWNVTSYLPQAERNIFFSLSKKEKFDVLYDVAFNNEDPRIYLDKIEFLITKYLNEIETLKRMSTEIILSPIHNKYISSNKLKK